MNEKLSQLHKTSVMSSHVLDFRGVKTAHSTYVAAERETMKRAVERKKIDRFATVHVTQNTSTKSIPSKYTKHFPQMLTPVKTLSLFLIVVLNLTSVFSVGLTNSYYSDSEESNGNVFATGLVDFVLETTPFEDMATTTPKSGEEVWNVDITPHDLSNPFYYYASSTNFHGLLELCDVIDVIATLDGEIMYEGLLTDLLTSTTTVISEWKFEFGGAVGFPGEMCHFDIDFNGWQTRHGLDEGGYSDTETVSYWILDPSVVINKVYFGESPSTEDWVELYNPTDSPIDISEGFLCDNNSCDTLPVVPPIPSGGYALIAGSEDILTQVDVSPEVILILVPDGMVGDGLTEEGDMLELRLSGDELVDQLNWGDSDEGWPNYTPLLWDPSIPAPGAGSALARISLGIDTNMPEDFVELMLPIVDIIEPNAASTWEPGEIETITWEAINPNGDDEDLRIDLYYIDASSTMHAIVFDTPNDGEHDWMVVGEEGSIMQIKIVATGPENVLLNTMAIADIGSIPGLILELEKKFSGVTLGFEPEQFSFHVVGGDIDKIVPHDSFIVLPVGFYTITELTPEGFYSPDWRIQWSGDECEGENIPGGIATIDVEERDLRKVVTYCRADNQYRPESNPENDETEVSALEERRLNHSAFTVTEEENATTTEFAVTSTPTDETSNETQASTTTPVATSTETVASASSTFAMAGTTTEPLTQEDEGTTTPDTSTDSTDPKPQEPEEDQNLVPVKNEEPVALPEEDETLPPEPEPDDESPEEITPDL
ncbi:lamin tail domain-containing protein [Candidatus Pacebacteria bacterium]|nr:lamin tail domain-containing protein [Candidatus Paceibacterota bacterium]